MADFRASVTLWTNVFGSVVLFDPTTQRPAADIQLFNVNSKTMFSVGREYFPSSFREIVEPTRIDAAVEAYAEWKHAHAQEIQRLKESKARDEAARAALLEHQRRRAIGLHRAYLEARGATKIGVRRATKLRRVTHCWKCKNDLDDTIDIECITCEWIICSRCGACGDGYELAKVPLH